jgi:hypothetical protein
MKNKLAWLTFIGAISILLIQLNGCYTQLGSTRDEKEDNEEYVAADTTQGYEAEGNEQGSEYTEGCCNDDYHPHVGFMYYYPMNYWPSTAFGFAYNNLWTYDYYGGWYDPWYSWGYSPWYYGSYYSPYYNPYYYPFYYPYYDYYPGGYYYGDNGYYAKVGKRDFGDVRAGGTERRVGGAQWDGASGLRDEVNTSTRVMRAGEGAATVTKRSGTSEKARVNTSIRDRDNRWNKETSNTESRNTESGTKVDRGQGQQTREAATQTRTPAVRTPSKDSGSDRKPGRREGVKNNSSQIQAPRYTPNRNSGSQPSPGVRSGGSYPRSQAPSYSPPPSSSPRSSSPPPSSGSRSGSSDRGSGSSGRRR